MPTERDSDTDDPETGGKTGGSSETETPEQRAEREAQEEVLRRAFSRASEGKALKSKEARALAAHLDTLMDALDGGSNDTNTNQYGVYGPVPKAKNDYAEFPSVAFGKEGDYQEIPLKSKDGDVGDVEMSRFDGNADEDDDSDNPPMQSAQRANRRTLTRLQHESDLVKRRMDRKWSAILAGSIVGAVGLASTLAIYFSGRPQAQTSSDDADENKPNKAPVAPNISDVEGALHPATIDIWGTGPHVIDPDDEDLLDKKKFKFVNPDDTAKRTDKVQQDGLGTWTYDKTNFLVVFTPDGNFKSGQASVDYVVKDKNDLESKPATLSVTYNTDTEAAIPPRAFDVIWPTKPNGEGIFQVNLLDGSTGQAPQFGKHEVAADRPILLLGLAAQPGKKTTLPTAVLLDKRASMVVKGEGTWTTTNSGMLTFTPLDDFKDSPTSVIYQLADSAGYLSNAAIVFSSKNMDHIIDAFGDLNAKTDKEFWDLFKQNLFASSTTPPSLEIDKTVLDGVIFGLMKITRQDISHGDLDALDNGLATTLGPDGKLSKRILAWMTASPTYTAEALYGVVKDIVEDPSGAVLEGPFNFGDINFEDRLARRYFALAQMHLMVDRYLVLLEEMTNDGPGQRAAG